MKLTWTILILVLLGVAVSAYPGERNSEQELEEIQDGTWKTWEAMKDFFRPMMNWFRNELPEKTPKDIANSVKETATDVKDWAANNGVVQTAVGALKPVQQWFSDTANTLKEKSFKEMFDDTREHVSNVDETVGGWISSQNKKE